MRAEFEKIKKRKMILLIKPGFTMSAIGFCIIVILKIIRRFLVAPVFITTRILQDAFIIVFSIQTRWVLQPMLVVVVALL